MSAQITLSANEIHNLIDYTINAALRVTHSETSYPYDTHGDVHEKAWNMALYGRTTR